jgi:hypothetical protein
MSFIINEIRMYMLYEMICYVSSNVLLLLIIIERNHTRRIII